MGAGARSESVAHTGRLRAKARGARGSHQRNIELTLKAFPPARLHYSLTMRLEHNGVVIEDGKVAATYLKELREGHGRRF